MTFATKTIWSESALFTLWLIHPYIICYDLCLTMEKSNTFNQTTIASKPHYIHLASQFVLLR